MFVAENLGEVIYSDAKSIYNRVCMIQKSLSTENREKPYPVNLLSNQPSKFKYRHCFGYLNVKKKTLSETCLSMLHTD